jgi:hypothetical protein
MSPTQRRRFTLIDATVLIAATAVALVPVRYAFSFGLVQGLPATWDVESGASFAFGLTWIVTPLLITWSVALWILRLRQPRPRLRRLFRQPGMAATTAILCALLLRAIEILGMVAIAMVAEPFGFAADGDLFSVDELGVQSDQWLRTLGGAVLAVWLVLWLARVGRCERSWIDLAGRLLGAFGMVYGLLSGWIAFTD